MFEMSVYYNKDSLANVLSCKHIASMQRTRVTIDTAVEKASMIQTNNHSFKFKQCQNGLYYIDMSNIDNHKAKNNITSYPNSLQTPVCLLNTVDFNEYFFSKR